MGFSEWFNTNWKWVILVFSILVVLIIGILMVNRRKNPLLNILITFKNTLTIPIQSVTVKDSKLNTYPVSISSSVAPNQDINIIIPKSHHNSDITSLSVYCCGGDEYSATGMAIVFILVNDNNTLVYVPVGSVYDKPTIVSTNLTNSVISPTIPLDTCSVLCTNDTYPMSGYLTVSNNYSTPLKCIVITNNDLNDIIGVELNRSDISEGDTITTNALLNPSKLIACVTFNESFFIVTSTILYKASNGKIIRTVFGTSPNSTVVNKTNTHHAVIQSNLHKNVSLWNALKK
jgi:hypothetical protein